MRRKYNEYRADRNVCSFFLSLPKNHGIQGSSNDILKDGGFGRQRWEVSLLCASLPQDAFMSHDRCLRWLSGQGGHKGGGWTMAWL